MTTFYVCEWAEKTAEKDVYESGCEGDREEIFDYSPGIKAKTLRGLIDALAEQFDLEIDTLFAPEDEGPIGYVSFNQLETESGEKPTEAELEQWKAGDLDLYLCDYTFGIKKQTTEEITTEELTAAGLQLH